jgi:hypothetical protein
LAKFAPFAYLFAVLMGVPVFIMHKWLVPSGLGEDFLNRWREFMKQEPDTANEDDIFDFP